MSIFPSARNVSSVIYSAAKTYSESSTTKLNLLPYVIPISQTKECSASVSLYLSSPLPLASQDLLCHIK